MGDKTSSKSKETLIEHPRITYHAVDRTFDRLFKEKSLDETRDVVRRKLGLSSDATVELVQLRDDRKIDLEDDDDFEAFRALARSQLHVSVLVIVKNGRVGPDPDHDESNGTNKAKRPSGKRKRSSSPAPVLPDHSQTSQSKKPTSKRAKEALPKASAIEPDTEAPARKEKRKVTFEDLLQNSHHSDRSAPTTPKAKVTKPASSSSRAKLHTVDAGLTVASSSRLPNIPVDNRHPPSKSAVNTSTLASMGLEAHVKSERKKKAKKDPSGPDPPSSFTLTALPARISVASSTDILQKASNNPSDIAKASIPRKSSDANLRLPPEKEHRKRKRSTEDLVPTHVLGETPAKKKRKKKREESIPLPGADGTSALVANIDTPAASSSFSGLVGGPATDVVPFSLPTSTSRAKRRKSIGDAGDLSHPFSKNPLDYVGGGPNPEAAPQTSTVALPTAAKTKKHKGKASEKQGSASSVPQESNPLSGEGSKGPGTEGRATAEGSTDTAKVRKTKKKSGPLSQTDSDALDATCKAFLASVLAEAGPSTHAVVPTKKRGQSQLSVSSDAGGVEAVEPLLGSTAKSLALPTLFQPSSKVFPDLSPLNTPSVRPRPQVVADLLPILPSEAQSPLALVDAPADNDNRKSAGEFCPACQEHASHPLAECPVVQDGADSMEECLAELEADPDLADPTIISELRALLSKARSERSDDRQPTPLREKTPASVSLSSASKPTIPAGLTISEVHIESRNEGSSNESSDDDDANESTKDPSVREPSPDGLLFEEKLAALLQGPERRGPRKSVLDEIPSDSHSDEESEKEDILLDEEEDLRTQLSRRRSKAFAREKSSSQEPDVVGLDGDADEGSKSVFMDHSQELPPYEQITSPDPDENPDGPPIDVAVAQSSRDRTLAPAGDEVEDVSLSIENELEQMPTPSNVQVPGGGAARGLLGSGFQRLASPESDATAINTEPGKSPSILSFHHTETPTSADTNQRILVPATPDNKPHHPASEPGRPAISATPIHRAAEDHAGATRGDDVESIQSADDLVERYEADGEDDPIEEASPPVSRAGQSPLTPGVVKRMKTGAKKSAHPEKELPVPTSLPSDSEKGPDTTPDDATPLPPRKSSRLPRQATAGPEPAPSPPPAPVPKKRGRKPLPEEEKARRAAAKQAEKEEKARVREEKARIAREAREKKAAEKRASMPPPKSVRSTKPIPSASNAEEKSTAKPAAAYQASQADLSQAEWAILSPGPQGQHSESSAVDELGPSSPDPGTGGKIVDLRPSSDAEAGSSTATHTKLPARMQLDDLDQGDIDASQGSTQSLSQEPLPLFYPGSSQFPQLNQSQTSPASPEPVDSDSDEEPLVAKARGPSTATTPYRRLTEIASQDGLFPTGSARTTPATVGQRTSHAGRVKGLLSQMDDDEESTTTESESDSDGTPSHIPRSRMAGKAQKTKKSGLLSFA